MTNPKKFFMHLKNRTKHVIQIIFRITAEGDERITAEGDARITANSDY